MFRDEVGIAQAAKGRLEQFGDTEPRYKAGDRVVIRRTGAITTITNVVKTLNMYQLEGTPSDTLFGAYDIRRES